MSEQFWWCAGRDGKLRTVEQAELCGELSRGSLEPVLLVWREGWASWLRAAEVQEFRSSLPPNTGMPIVSPKLDASVTDPPPPPLEKYQPSPRGKTLVGMPAVQLPDAPAAARPASSRPPPPRPASTRPPPPRPMGSRPPPPRKAVKQTMMGIAPPRELKEIEVDVVLDEDELKSVTEQPKVEPVVSDGYIIPVASDPDHEPPVPQNIPRQDVTQLIEPVTKGENLKSAEPSPPTGAFEEVPPPVAAIGAPRPATPTPSGAESKDVSKKSPDLNRTQIIKDDKAAPADPSAPKLGWTAAMTPGGAGARPLGRTQVIQPSGAPTPGAPARPLGQTMLVSPEAAPPTDPIVPVPSGPEHDAPTQIRPAGDMIQPVDDADDGPTVLRPALSAEATPLPAFKLEEYPSQAGLPAPAPLPAPAQQQPMYAPSAVPPPPKKSILPLLLVGGGVAVIGLIGVALVARMYLLTDSKKPVASAPAVSAAPPPPAPPKACTLATPAKKLADEINVGVPPYLAGMDGRVAIGLVVGTNKAVGMTLDLGTLESKPENETTGANLYGVVPLVEGGALKFQADRQDDELKYARTVDAKKSFTLGMTSEGFARRTEAGKPELLWPGGAGEKLTEIRVASVSEQGHAITFRRGGQSGEIRIGWLAPDGSRKSALGAVQGGGFVGTPAIAANDKDVLVAFAARDSESDPWHVALATAPHGDLPARSRVFDLPSGGPGGDAIAPSAAGLSGGRWLLQWTEGASQSRSVRVQTLDADLKPIEKPISVSPDGKSAGQGVAFAAQERGLSLFLVKSERAYELWGASFECK